MCGIFAIYNSNVNYQTSERMVGDAISKMNHRGPDDWGVYANANIGLGHKRLSIIDLSSAGHQPMFSQNKDIAIVFNGEIYNFKTVKNELTAKGHTFQSHCDTEVIIHAYQEWGKECVHKFIGMFAFVIWDSKKNLIWVVRDRLGIKPLYYHYDKGTFVCASEIKPLLATGLVSAKINERVLDSYFTLGYVPAPETMFKGINKLLPGHHITVGADGIHDQEYWDFASIPQSNISLSEAQNKVAEVLSDSVRLRLISDVPLGVFLSGGLDSSAVTAVMHDIVKDPINTFTVGYDKKFKVGEEYYADIVARRFNTNHNVFKLEPDSFFESIKTLVNFAEEPIVEPAAIALYHISKLAREKAIVLLSGEGSDEIFGGYYLYQFMNKMENMRKFLPSPVLKLAGLSGSLFTSMKYRKYADWLSLPLEKRYMGTSSYLTPSLKRDFYDDSFNEAKGSYLQDTFASYFSKVSHKKDTINKMLYVDTKTWLVDDLLIKADKMTMAASIELRVPFLDHRLVELAASLPSSYKIRNGEGKYILKSIMDSRLPKEIVYRKKMGFPVPTNNWFSGELYPAIKDILTKKPLPWINSKTVNTMLVQQETGREDHSKLLMMLLVQTFWQDNYLRNSAGKI